MLNPAETLLFFAAAAALLWLSWRRGQAPAENTALTREPSYFPQLDGLRFFAFLLVMWHHFPVYHDSNLGWFLARFGWIGVDLFFTLSSFLFFFLLFKEQDLKGKIDVPRFFLRRVLRIWPLYFFYLVLMLLVFPGALGHRAAGLFLFADNVFVFLERAYNHSPAWSGHLWTISYEEQVYLATPFLFMLAAGLVKSRRFLALAALFAAIPLAGCVARLWLASQGLAHPSSWTIPFLRSETLFAGFGLAIFVRSEAYRRVPNAFYWAVLGCALFSFALAAPAKAGTLGGMHPHDSPYVYLVLALAFSSLLLLALAPGTWFQRFFSLRPLAWLGKISYGLYVWHPLGIYLAMTQVVAPHMPGLAAKSASVQWLVISLISLGIITALAATSYQLLELPFLKLKRRFTIAPNKPL